MQQKGLFALQTDAPLAELMRPERLNELVGQEHLLGKGALLEVAIAQNRPFSLLLWGAAGVGKTSLALLLARAFKARFVRLSAVCHGVKDVREAMLEAGRWRESGERTIVFIDEIHRFNRAQQDVLLPYVEDATVYLIGATTENPTFYLTGALLSRLRVLRLASLSPEAIKVRLNAALLRLDNGALCDAPAVCRIAEQAAGDLRRALGLLEGWLALVKQGMTQEEALAQVLLDMPNVLSAQEGGEYALLSAFHKSLRGSNPDAAMYWFARLLENGVEPLVMARRLLCVASEDIGNADPRALTIALNAFQAFERLGTPEGLLALAQAITYLSLAPKSNASYLALKRARAFVAENPAFAVPAHLCNASSGLQREMGWGKGYRYAHDEAHGYAAGERYLPAEMGEVAFYQPVRRGFEIKLADKYDWLKRLDAGE